jgi:C4-type Zn-finger protein
MRRPARGSKEDGYRDRDTKIAYDGKQEARHVFLQIAWTDALRKQLGRSKVQRLLHIRM